MAKKPLLCRYIGMSSRSIAKKSSDALEIRNVLLLDNDKELTDSLRTLLEARNFVVTIVNNGADGLREILGMDFDAIICDLMMPQMPGDMFYLAVKRTKPYLCPRFIFITGYGGNPRVERFLSKAEGSVIIKSVLIEDLAKAIDEIIAKATR